MPEYGKTFFWRVTHQKRATLILVSSLLNVESCAVKQTVHGRIDKMTVYKARRWLFTGYVRIYHPNDQLR